MSVTVEEPQRASKGGGLNGEDITIAKETSEKEPANVDNNADVKKATEPTQYGQNDNRDRGAPRIVMAYIPASAPASPIPSHNTPAPGCKTPEASNGGGRPVTPNLTAKLNQAIHEYRAREERVGDLGQPDDEGYEGDANSPGAHQGCCDHDHENQHAAHDEQYSPEYQQQYCSGRPSPPFNASWEWAPHQAASHPLYMQPPFRPPFQHQQQQYAIPHYQPAAPPSYRPRSFPFPYHPHAHHFPHPYQPTHHQHITIPPPPPPHLFAPPPPTHPSDPRISPPHLHPVSPYASSIQAHPHPHPDPHPFQHPQAQDPNVIELTQRLQNIQAQLNGLDAAHEIEIWRHGKYNFHRRRAKQLRKIKREKVEEMVGVVRELRALGVSGGQLRGRQYSPQPQGQQETQGMCWTPPGSGYGAGFEQGWGRGQETGYWSGYGHQQEHAFGEEYGHGQHEAGSWSEVEVGHGGHGECCGCSDDGAYVDSPRDSAFESMACECACTTIDGEAGPAGETNEASLSPSPASFKQTSTGVTTGDAVTPGGTRARALSLDGMREQVEAVESHEQQHGDANENEKDEKTSSRERTSSWSDAEAVISEELRGIWRKKMSE